MTVLEDLACPKCGGKLQRDPETASYNCSYCGSDFSLNSASQLYELEGFARCPVCRRNDMVRKLSAIVHEGTQEINGTTIEKTSYQDKDGRWHTGSEKVPFSGTQTSGAAKRLAAPPKPAEPKKPPKMAWGCLWTLGMGYIWLASASFFLFGLFMFFTALYQMLASDYSAVEQMLLGLGASVLGVLIHWGWRSGKKRNAKDTDRYTAEMEQYTKNVIPRWEQRMKTWDQLYYCKRDDVVFHPGRQQSAKPEMIGELLEKSAGES